MDDEAKIWHAVFEDVEQLAKERRWKNLRTREDFGAAMSCLGLEMMGLWPESVDGAMLRIRDNLRLLRGPDVNERGMACFLRWLEAREGEGK